MKSTPRKDIANAVSDARLAGKAVTVKLPAIDVRISATLAKTDIHKYASTGRIGDGNIDGRLPSRMSLPSMGL